MTTPTQTNPVYESPEELAAEVVRLRDESARAFSDGVETMRSAAARAMVARPADEWAAAGEDAGADAAQAIGRLSLTGHTPELPEIVSDLVKIHGAEQVRAALDSL